MAKRSKGLALGWPLVGGRYVPPVDPSGLNPPTGFVILTRSDGTILTRHDGTILIRAA